MEEETEPTTTFATEYELPAAAFAVNIAGDGVNE